eukprot:COSAG06_NODE_226_length_19747_cov_9.234121_13_plen_703_part_00
MMSQRHALQARTTLTIMMLWCTSTPAVVSGGEHWPSPAGAVADDSSDADDLALPVVDYGALSNSWWVDPITIKVTHDRRKPYPSSTKRVDLAAQRGECERAQVWAWDTDSEHSDVQIQFSDLISAGGSTTISKDLWSYKQQGFVRPAAPPKFYRCIEDIVTGRTAAAGVPPQPLPQPGSDCSQTPWGVCWTGCPYKWKNFTDPMACNGGRTRPAPRRPDGTPDSCNRCQCNKANTTCPHPSGPIYDEHACLSGWYPDPLLDVPASGIPYVPKGFTQPIVLELCVPYGQAAANYSGSLEVLSATAGSLFSVRISVEVWDIDIPRINDTDSFNTVFNFGDSNMYKWYPPGTTAETMWNDWHPFLAHFRIPGDDIYGRTPRELQEFKVLADNGAKWMALINEGISWRPPANGTLPPHYARDLIEKLEPVMEGLSDLGLSNKGFVYGFDEMPAEYNQSVFEIYGALKSKWPNLTTVATLDWESFPPDLPLDVWIDEYADYGLSASYRQPTSKQKLRQQWLARDPKHQFWWYWCIGPENPMALNTFIERPAIQARLLFWLTALHNINGMLYYDVAIWKSQCPAARPCKPVGRINNTALTDFNPATFNHGSTPTGGADGDGSFTYPGPGGKPLGSIRLSNIADGIEDWELFNKLGATDAYISHAADLIVQLVENETVRVENPQLLETVRRQAARRVMALGLKLDAEQA